jgi:hypothetical protein
MGGSSSDGRPARASALALACLTSGAVALAPSVVSVARAQDAVRARGGIQGPRVALEIEACEGVDPEIVRRILGVELGPDVDLDAPADARASRVRVSCEESSIALVLDEPLTGTHLERSIAVGASPAASRSRLVALAATELLAASWIDLGMRHDPEVEVVGAGGPEETRAVALDIARARLPAEETVEAEVAAPVAPAPPPHGGRAIAVIRVSGEPLHFAGGGGLAADFEVLAPLVIALDVRAEVGSVEAAELGSVRLTAAWGTALAGLRLPLGRSHTDVLVGGRFGFGWLDGIGARGVVGAQVSGPVAGVVGASHLSLHMAYATFLHIGIELSWITLPIEGTDGATGASVARLDGAQMALTVGFEVRPE